MTTESNKLRTWPMIWWTACLVYLGAMFLGTHIPLKMEQLTAHNKDKLLHLAAYGGLGLLVSWRVSRLPRWLRQFWLAWGAILLWACVDEITQPLVGRTLDVYDWIADAIGSAFGLVLGVCLFGASPSAVEPIPSAD